VVARTHQEPLLALLKLWRTSHLPAPALTDALHAALAEAHEAALARDVADAAAAAASRATAASAAASAAAAQKKKGGKKGKGGGSAADAFADADDDAALTAAATAAVDADPHGVKAALKPSTDLLLSPEHESVVANARSQIRRYCSAVQVSRVRVLFLARCTCKGPRCSLAVLRTADASIPRRNRLGRRAQGTCGRVL
jgi:hypothetical protein